MRLTAKYQPFWVLIASTACYEPEGVTGPGSGDPGTMAAVPAQPLGEAYYPGRENVGGWRRVVEANRTPTTHQKSLIRTNTGLDWNKLKLAWDASSKYGGAFLVIRHGWVAGEWGTTSALAAASCTKTLSSLAVHRMFELSSRGSLPKSIAPESFAYQYLPASWGKDERRRAIRMRHLLTMSSGLQPDDSPPSPGGNTSAYQTKLLAPPVRTGPDKEWIYASLPVDVTSMVTTNATGRKLGDFFNQRIGSTIGVTSLRWASLGSYSYASAYSRLTARDMARIMYLLLQRGSWNGTRLVAASRIEQMTQWDPALEGTVYGPQITFPTDANTHKRYGRLTWTNRTRSAHVGDGVPADAFYCAGFKTNFAMAVPSLDLVVVRLQNGPAPWSDAVFTSINSKVMAAVMDGGSLRAEPAPGEMVIDRTGRARLAPAYGEKLLDGGTREVHVAGP